MEMIKDILEFLITFGVVDGFITYKFYRVIGECRKNKFYELFVLCLVSAILKQTTEPIIYQIIFYQISVLYNVSINGFKVKKSLILTLKLFVFMLISESLYVFFIDMMGFDITYLDNIHLFIFMIPEKIIMFIIIKMKGSFKHGNVLVGSD